MFSPPYQINGTQPDVVGKPCTGFYLLHLYTDSQIRDIVNVAYFEFDSRWHRLYFDGLFVFWRSAAKPEEPENSDLKSGLLLNNLTGMSDIVGHILVSLEYHGSNDGVEVQLVFSSGKSIWFRHSSLSDTTRFDG